MQRLIAALSCTLLLAPGCDSAPKKEASAKTADKQADSKKADDNAAPKAADPHANPHAAMADPHAGIKRGPAPEQAQPGPPRDIKPSGEVTAASVTGLTLAVPSEWESSPPTSSMRLGQWALPGPGGDGELVVFRFPGGGGGVQANIDRWKGQFQPPEGKTIDDVSTVKTIDGDGGLKTTLVEVTGTYVAAVQPGDAEKHNDAAYQMFAAVVEGSGDAYYFKATGPQKTLAIWAEPFVTMIGTFKADPAAGGQAPADAKGAPAKPPTDAKAEPGKEPSKQ